MKQALTRVFQYYGPILDVIAKSSLKRKGQAFIVFDSEKAALEAVEEMNGFEMYGKVMRVHRAKTHSDETVKRKAPDMFEDHKRKRLTLKGTIRTFSIRQVFYAKLLQILSVPKKTRKRKPIPSPPRSLAPPKLELPPSPTNTCDPTRRSFCRTSPATSTRTTLRPYSSASRASRKCAWYQSGLLPLPSLKTSSLRLRQKRQRRIPRSALRASL